MTYCAIDFGTSNSAVAVPNSDELTLAPVEGAFQTLPTAVFFNVDDHSCAFGRAALAAYTEGFDGRLMRSIKSILGSSLAEGTTDRGDGSAIRYLDVVTTFIRHLKRRAEHFTHAPIERAVMGRPVFFVDDDPVADARAEHQLAHAARAAGFDEVLFQYEPIAAALDYESRLDTEQLVMVADLGGGTSDFSLVRVGPQRRTHVDRKTDVLAHHGVHVAGTDFDRRVELSAILPEFGYRTLDMEGRELPNRIYFDLATWHLINTVYTPKRTKELHLMRHLFRDTAHHQRLMRVVHRRLGHALAARAEQTKIALAASATASIDLESAEKGLRVEWTAAALIDAARDETNRIAHAARETARLAGVAPGDVDAVYFTGGSSGLNFLTAAIKSGFEKAQPVYGDRMSSVAAGLGIYAKRMLDGVTS
ncbi:molecular chaperone-like protein [Caballeronia sordidicola]|uniref:Molecular chaperone-like protein n=1 Tax=Caballeronia sordidicola TaxID=196367 RepID=A0A158G738_CABSO|nr:Hsp70 family protein [Caballeronia sordidicola]SAL27693.1 molecular chaperone-like protein [Caballeronia sordidicola]